MWQRFTEAARRAIFYAQNEAQTDQVTLVTPEHLLIALLREPESRSYRIVARCGADIPAIVVALRSPSVKTEEPMTDMTLSIPAKKAIDFSYEEAREMDSVNIDSAHLLLGVLREGGSAAQTLQTHGVTLDTARVAAQEITGEPASGEAA